MDLQAAAYEGGRYSSVSNIDNSIDVRVHRRRGNSAASGGCSSCLARGASTVYRYGPTSWHSRESVVRRRYTLVENPALLHFNLEFTASHLAIHNESNSIQGESF